MKTANQQTASEWWIDLNYYQSKNKPFALLLQTADNAACYLRIEPGDDIDLMNQGTPNCLRIETLKNDDAGNYTITSRHIHVDNILGIYEYPLPKQEANQSQTL